LAVARTTAVNVFVMIEAFYLFNCRSLTRPFWRLGWFSNPWIWFGAGAMMGLQLMFTYLPLFNRLFGTAPIGPGHWLAIVVCGLAASLVIALEKWLRRRTDPPSPAVE
jgi:magnesium-transporting ATPase (P-type)